MILKLRMIGDNKRLSYKLIDNIKGIEYKYMDEPRNIKEIKESGTLYINTYPNVVDKVVVEFSIEYENKMFDMIYTDDIVYILNDNGKTCDTINA